MTSFILYDQFGPLTLFCTQGINYYHSLKMFRELEQGEGVSCNVNRNDRVLMVKYGGNYFLMGRLTLKYFFTCIGVIAVTLLRY